MEIEARRSHLGCYELEKDAKYNVANTENNQENMLLNLCCHKECYFKTNDEFHVLKNVGDRNKTIHLSNYASREDNVLETQVHRRSRRCSNM